MNQQEIIKRLNENHQTFIDLINALDEKNFDFSNNGKWTGGQQLEHIYLAVKPVVLALSLPKFLPKILFGKPNRKGLTHSELVNKYLMILQNGGKASKAFIPKAVNIKQRNQLSTDLWNTVQRLNSKLTRFTEEELDTIMLPHPLLGELTMREMLYFTIHHVKQHKEITKRNLVKV